MEINSCSGLLEFNQLMESFIERYDFGYNKFKPSFDEKEKLVKTIAHHFIVSSKLEEIQKFMEGLASEGVLEVLQRFPKDAMKMFLYQSLSSEVVKSMLTAVHSTEKFKMEAEEDVLFYLFNFIDEVGFGKVEKIKYNDIIVIDDEFTSNETMSEKQFSLEDLLFFLTGSKFPSSSRIEVLFNHDSSRRLFVSTCMLQITFPVSKRYTDGENFTQNFLEDIFNAPGFGTV